MDVLLIYPKAGHDIRGITVNAPLALLSVASTLIKDFSVTILDQRACDDFWGTLDGYLKQQPLIIGITSMTGTQIYHGLEITKYIKERSQIPVVWGGMHPTICAAQTVVKPYIDFVLRGEGELSMLALVRLLARQGKDYEKVPGLVWKKSGQIFGTAQADPLEMNELPKIPWHLVDVNEYTSPASYLYPGVKRLLPFQGSRGCPFKCTFCSEPALTKRYRMMSPTKMVDECLEIVSKYDLNHITFFDEEFFVNRRWAMQVAEGIGGKFTWWAQTRAKDLLKTDLKKLEKCGLHVLAPGLESGSDRVLNYMRKGENVEEYREANKMLMETQIQAQYNFIIGLPTETRKELYETIDLVLEFLRKNPNAIVNQLSPLTPLPGTEMLNQVERDFQYRIPDRLEEWIRMTRGNQKRPWLNAADVRLIRFLYYTSLFVCSAERYAQKLGIPKFLLRIYSATVKWRWQKKWMSLDWEIPLMRLLFRWFVNPIDYTLPEDYGDSFAAKESEVIMVRQDDILPLGGVNQTEQRPTVPVISRSA